MRRSLVIATGAVLLLTGPAVAAEPAEDAPIHGCVHSKSGALRVVKAGETCRAPEVALTWNRQGPAGEDGDDAALGLESVTSSHIRDETIRAADLDRALLSWLVTQDELDDRLRWYAHDDELAGVAYEIRELRDELGTPLDSPNAGGAVDWTQLVNVPAALADGTDDVDGGRAADLACTRCVGDGEVTSLSWTKLFDVAVTGAHVVDESLTHADIARDAIGEDELRENSVTGTEIVDGAVGISDLDGEVQRRLVSYRAFHDYADPPVIPAGTRVAVDVSTPGLAPGDIVSLVPPLFAYDGILYVGHVIPSADTLRVYLYNATPADLDPGWATITGHAVDLTP